MLCYPPIISERLRISNKERSTMSRAYRFYCRRRLLTDWLRPWLLHAIFGLRRRSPESRGGEQIWGCPAERLGTAARSLGSPVTININEHQSPTYACTFRCGGIPGATPPPPPPPLGSPTFNFNFSKVEVTPFFIETVFYQTAFGYSILPKFVFKGRNCYSPLTGRRWLM